MSVKFQLTDKDGNIAKINGEGEISVVVHPHPPKNESENALPYRAYFTNTAGSNDMVVDGSSTPVSFCITADPLVDVYIKTISVLISDVGAELDEFGGLTALSNGVEFKWSSQINGDIVIADAVTTNFEMVRLCAGTEGFGTTTNVFRANNVSGQAEGYIPVMDLSDVFGLPYGIRLKAGSTDKLVWTVNDALAGLDAFNIIGYGIKW